MASASKSFVVRSDVLEDVVECCICSHCFDGKEHMPKILQCGHHFCLDCIRNLEQFHDDDVTSQYVYCPSCRNRSKLPEREQDLTTVFAVLSVTAGYKKLFDRQSTSSVDEEAAEFCDCGEPFSDENFNYCENCSLAVCNGCAWKNHRRHAKDCHSADIYATYLTTRVQNLKEECQQTLLSLKQQLDETEDRAELIFTEVKKASKAVENQYDDLITCLKESRAEMLSAIKRYEKENMARVEKRHKVVQSEISRLQSWLSLADETLAKKECSSVIRMRNTIVEKLVKNAAFQGTKIPDLLPVGNLVLTPSEAASKISTERHTGSILFERSQWDGFEMSDIIGSNHSYLELLLQWIKETAGEGAQWKRCFRALKHGFEASAFHRFCDNKKTTLTIIQSGEYIFGGYTDNKWNSPAFGGEFRQSKTSWLFSLKNAGNLKPFKLPSTEEPQCATCAKSSYGPTFGYGHDLHICHQAKTEGNSYTNLGRSYQPPQGYAFGSEKIKSLLAGSYGFYVNDYEVFYKV